MYVSSDVESYEFNPLMRGLLIKLLLLLKACCQQPPLNTFELSLLFRFCLLPINKTFALVVEFNS